MVGKWRRFPGTIPSTVHVTHAKAGSTWLDGIWRQLLGAHVAPRGKLVARDVNGDLARHLFAPDRFYSAMFMTRDELDRHAEVRDAARFVVIRDLRDTLVSLYFSWKTSHPPNVGIAKERARLNAIPQEEGLLYLVRERLTRIAEIQTSWMESDAAILRYEDLLSRDEEFLSQLLLGELKIALAPKRIRKAVAAHRFEARFKRPLGVEDVNSHGRQGASGNWKRHFSSKVAEAFAERFGSVLRKTGYAIDDDWVNDAGSIARDVQNSSSNTRGAHGAGWISTFTAVTTGLLPHAADVLEAALG
jgi:lipopolysaccharide transport system ATP-binding protein